jgi:hypothetical protein
VPGRWSASVGPGPARFWGAVAGRRVVSAGLASVGDLPGGRLGVDLGTDGVLRSSYMLNAGFVRHRRAGNGWAGRGLPAHSARARHVNRSCPKVLAGTPIWCPTPASCPEPVRTVPNGMAWSANRHELRRSCWAGFEGGGAHLALRHLHQGESCCVGCGGLAVCICPLDVGVPRCLLAGLPREPAAWSDAGASRGRFE